MYMEKSLACRDQYTSIGKADIVHFIKIKKLCMPKILYKKFTDKY